MNNREIDLTAQLNTHGYNVALVINGRQFAGAYCAGCTASEVYHAITDDIKSVYGRRLFEDVTGHRDVLHAMDCVWNIILNLH